MKLIVLKRNATTSRGRLVSGSVVKLPDAEADWYCGAGVAEPFEVLGEIVEVDEKAAAKAAAAKRLKAKKAKAQRDAAKAKAVLEAEEDEGE